MNHSPSVRGDGKARVPDVSTTDAASPGALEKESDRISLRAAFQAPWHGRRQKCFVICFGCQPSQVLSARAPIANLGSNNFLIL